jgi:hypothetical protein
MDSKRIFVSKNFSIMLEEFIKKFKEVNGIELSLVQATDLVFKKIQKAGGLAI